MSELSVPHVLGVLRSHLARLVQRQETDPAAGEYGAVIDSSNGLGDTGHGDTGIAAMSVALLCAAEATGHRVDWGQGLDRDHAIGRAELMLDHILRRQRTSGRIDYLSCNIDSAPDTAFVMQMFCAAAELARLTGLDELSYYRGLRDRLGEFVAKAAPGVAEGGFHTPNHRWVISSALAQAAAMPGMGDYRDVVDAYLGETIDLDADGAFIEHSGVIYDAVCDRSLMLVAEATRRPGLLDKVRRNLDLNLHLLHADGRIETIQSHRTDREVVSVPVGLSSAYLMAHRLRPDAVYQAAAEWLWRGELASGEDTVWMAYVLLRYGADAPAPKAELPSRFSRLFADAGVGRIRDGKLSVTVPLESRNLLRLFWREAGMTAMYIRHSYFGAAGDFWSDRVDWRDDGLVIHSDGVKRDPRRPGYELPLARPVGHHEWTQALDARKQYRLPPADAALHARRINGGLALRLVSSNVPDGVLVQVAMDFPAGGLWQSADAAETMKPGQIICLDSGAGRMTLGRNYIEIVGGKAAHRSLHMRDGVSVGGCARVVINLVTPVDHEFAIRGG